MSWLQRLRAGLRKTQQNFARLAQVLVPGRAIDQGLLEELEAILIGADVGVEATQALLDELQHGARERGLGEASELLGLLRELLLRRLEPAEGALALRHDGQPTVFLVLGVNGSGKTTTIAKLARYLRAEHGVQRPVFAAADTFRAAAIEQLAIWAERVGTTLIRHRPGADPSAVAYDALEHALKRQADAVFIDTAGRLHTQRNLMEELKKIHRVVERRLGRPADERLLVLDATIGQNAIQQAKLFHEAVPLTGLVLTKLDGTAKGGAIVPIAHRLGLPVKLIGVGEELDDLRPFRAREFLEALFTR